MLEQTAEPAIDKTVHRQSGRPGRTKLMKPLRFGNVQRGLVDAIEAITGVAFAVSILIVKWPRLDDTSLGQR